MIIASVFETVSCILDRLPYLLCSENDADLVVLLSPLPKCWCLLKEETFLKHEIPSLLCLVADLLLLNDFFFFALKVKFVIQVPIGT